MNTVETLMEGLRNKMGVLTVLEQIEQGLFPRDSKGRPKVTTQNKMEWSIVATDRVGGDFPIIGINLNASQGGGQQVWKKNGRATKIRSMSDYDIIPIPRTRQKFNVIKNRIEIDAGCCGNPSLEIEFSLDRISYEQFLRNKPINVMLSRVSDAPAVKIGDVIETTEGHARYKIIATDVPGAYPLTGYLMQTNDWGEIGEIEQWTKEGHFDKSRTDSGMNLDMPKNKVLATAATVITSHIPFERMPNLKLKVMLPPTSADKFDEVYRALADTKNILPEIWTVHYDGYYTSV